MMDTARPLRSLSFLLAVVASMATGCNDESPVAPNATATATAAQSAATAATSASAAAKKPKTTSSKTYAEVLASIDKRAVELESIVAKRPKDWLMRSHLLELLLKRASLSHSFDDYARIKRLLDETLAMAPFGAGPPLLLAARFNFTLHRLEQTEEHLAEYSKLELLRQQAAPTLEMIAADIAFHRGQYAEAWEGYRKLARRSPGTALSKLAIYHSKTGASLEAEALLDMALSSKVYPDSESHGRSWLMLQRAILSLEGGRYQQAMTRLKEADATFPGWWLIREHIAEVHTLLGQDDEAIALYEQVVNDTGHPQFMDALGECYQRAGRQDEAQKLFARATELWDKHIAEFPDAAGGHGLEHYLEHGDNPSKALELALANFRARPGGEARVLLAAAYLANDQPDKALAQARTVLATPFRSADLHDVAHESYMALGQKAEAAQQRQLCLQMNPKFYAPKPSERPSAPGPVRSAKANAP